MYLANLSANTSQLRTLVDPQNSLPHLLDPMVNLSVWAPVIPDGVETTLDVSSSAYVLTTMITNYLAPVLYQGSLTYRTEDGQSSLVGCVENLSCNCVSYSCDPALHDMPSGLCLLVFSLGLHPWLTHLFWICPIQLLVIVTSFIPYASFVGKSGLTCMQNIASRSTHSSHYLSSSVCNLMRHGPIHSPLLAYGAWRCPTIYPANRIPSDRRPRHIPYYKMCSNYSDLWCWDATTQAAGDDAPSQRRGSREVLSLFFKVHLRQGRVTLSQESVREVCAPNSKRMKNRP